MATFFFLLGCLIFIVGVVWFIVGLVINHKYDNIGPLLISVIVVNVGNLILQIARLFI